jgi:hypothetical protein
MQLGSLSSLLQQSRSVGYQLELPVALVQLLRVRLPASLVSLVVLPTGGVDSVDLLHKSGGAHCSIVGIG